MAKKKQGYEITEEDIQKTINYLKLHDPKKANREGAVFNRVGLEITVSEKVGPSG